MFIAEEPAPIDGSSLCKTAHSDRPWALELSSTDRIAVLDDFFIPRTPRESPMSKLAYTATALLFALSATVASAQTPQPVPQAAPPGPAAQILPSIPANAMTVTHWYKQSVYDPSDSKIGEIMDVLVDRDGKVVALIVGVGGFLGMGEKDIAVPFKAVQFRTKDSNKWYPVMNTTKDALKNARGYKYDRSATTWVPENSPVTTGTPATPSPRPSAR
jgi:sporulation protein YlmC with PRC-barrel domain